MQYLTLSVQKGELLKSTDIKVKEAASLMDFICLVEVFHIDDCECEYTALRGC